MKCLLVAAALFSLLIEPAFPQIGIPWPGPGTVSAAPPAIGTPVSLGCAVGTAGASSVTLTTAAAIPIGALAVVGVFVGFSAAQTVTGVSDGTNTTYTQAVHSPWDATGDVVTDMWYQPNAAAVGSSASLTASFSTASSGGTNAPVICAAYVTGVIAAAPIDKTNFGKTNNGTAYASGTSGTLTISNEIAFGFIGAYNAAATITEGTGFTNINSAAQGTGSQWQARLSFKTVAATTALNYQPSTSVNTFGAALIGTFKGH